MNFWKKKGKTPLTGTSKLTLVVPHAETSVAVTQLQPKAETTETTPQGSFDGVATVNSKFRAVFEGQTTETKRKAKEPMPKQEKYGLFCFHDQPSENAFAVDIIAVHGLNGHFQESWEVKDESGKTVNWLKDFLPQQIPSARVLSFGYNSSLWFSKSTSDIGEFAQQLLEDLMSYRNSQMRRPIFFICHSLGGIVVKKALIIAREHRRYKFSILSNVRSVLFFGTPHRGATHAAWGSTLGSIVKAASFGTHTHPELCKTLELDSSALNDISKSFVEQTNKITIYTFYETDKMNWMNRKAVEDSSAILGVTNEVVIPILGDHCSIVKFGDIDEQRYRKVWTALQSATAAESQKAMSNEEETCHQSLYTSSYEMHKKRNPSPVTGTCRWILKHQLYRNWLGNRSPSLLWISADAGCGKSVLSSFLIDYFTCPETRSTPPTYVCYFFFKDDNDEQSNAKSAVSAILHQLYVQQPGLIKCAMKYERQKGDLALDNFHVMWKTLIESIEDPSLQGDVICILDGLDECELRTRQLLLTALSTYYTSNSNTKKSGPVFKTILASRPDNDIKAAFYKTPEIRLRGEDEVDAINQDVALVVQANIDDIIAQGIPRSILGGLKNTLIERADRTFLWTTMIIDLLKDATKRGASKKEMTEILASKDIYTIYERLLNRAGNIQQARKCLRIVLVAARPLGLDELNAALMVDDSHKEFSDLENELIHPFENHVVFLCGHFIRIIHSTVYFVHQTARDFLLQNEDYNSTSNWQHSVMLSDAHYTLLKSCIYYLELLNSQQQYDLSIHQPGLYAFVNYAARHWPAHFRESEDQCDINTIYRCAQLCTPMSKSFPAWFGKYFLSHSQNDYATFFQTPRNIEVTKLLELDALTNYLLASAHDQKYDDGAKTHSALVARDTMLDRQRRNDIAVLMLEMRHHLETKDTIFDLRELQDYDVVEEPIIAGAMKIPPRKRAPHQPDAVSQPHAKSNAFGQAAFSGKPRFVV